MKKFAFIVHPRTLSDVERHFPFVKYLPDTVVYGGLRLLRRFPNLCLCSSFDVYGTAEGYILAVPLTAGQMTQFDLKVVRKTILNTLRFAQNKLGVDVIGLGAFIASVTDGGRWLVRQPEVKASVTHGDSFAAAIAMGGLTRILEKKKGMIGIVGSTGIIGRGLARMLSSNGNRLLLFGRNQKKLEIFADRLNTPGLVLTTNIEYSRYADILITATSHFEALLKANHIKRGAVIYDVSQPEAVSPALLKVRRDIVRVDGALVNIPGIDLKFEMGPPSGTTFACLAETMLQTLEGIEGHHVGDIDPTYMDEVRQAGKKYGFTHAPFTCFGKRLNGKLH